MAAIRWQDWVNVALGFWLMLSPWAIDYSLNGAATANACGLGVVLLAFNLISVSRLLDQGQEIFNIVLGVWLVCSPYSLNFAAEWGPAINAIGVGASVVLLAAWQIYDAAKKTNRG